MSVHRFAQATAAMTLLLLVAGGLVTSTDSGLSVPDWPLSYGTLFPPMVGGIAFEHTHRMIAAVVGVLIAILAGWLWRTEPRRWVRCLGYAALGGVIAQAILGGLTVLLVLPPSISVAHACLGQLVFCLVVSLAVVTARRWHAARAGVADSLLPRLCLVATGLLFVQLLLGAVIRHTGSGVGIHMTGALIIWMLIAAIIWRLRRVSQYPPFLFRLALTIGVAITGQVVLGALVLFAGPSVAFTTAHVALGALILASSCVLTLLVSRASGLAHADPSSTIPRALIA